MTPTTNAFGGLFKKFRLRSEFSTLSQFGDALAKERFIYEDSIYSHWQKSVRIPKDRKLLLTIIKIFIERGGITTIKECNNLLDSAGQKNVTDEELVFVTKNVHFQEDVIKPADALSFLLTTIKSKEITRTGWKMAGIPHPESVAEHSFQLCVIAMVFADKLGVDREKIVKMAIIHDMGEIFTGDLVWSRGSIVDIEKRRKKEFIEAEGIENIFSRLGNSKEYQTIFKEMTERKSHEAEVFWQLDKLEMAIQALYYEQKTGISLDEFFTNTNFQLTFPFLREIFSCVLAERPKKNRKQKINT